MRGELQGAAVRVGCTEARAGVVVWWGSWGTSATSARARVPVKGLQGLRCRAAGVREQGLAHRG